MQWSGGSESSNVEDKRGMGGAAIGGLGGLSIIGVIMFLIQGGDPAEILNKVQQGGNSKSPLTQEQSDNEAKFVKVVLKMTEDVWNDQFKQQGLRYREPKLELFTNSTATACGTGQAAMGPFYCPGDQKVYIDLIFFNELKKLTGTNADFARAYVIAHEVGHHVQNLMGYSTRVDEARQSRRVSKEELNRLSVRLELQADYLAGVWGHHANKQRKILEPGDIEEGLKAAEGIGDDKLMRGSGRVVRPESFTHGTSAQRQFYLKQGLRDGDASKQTLDRFFTTPYEQLGR